MKIEVSTTRSGCSRAQVTESSAWRAAMREDLGAQRSGRKRVWARLTWNALRSQNPVMSGRSSMTSSMAAAQASRILIPSFWSSLLVV